MEQVANALTKHAVEAVDVSDANLFGRSAFNRYYYAVFLAVRAMIQYGHPEIAQFKHKNMPDDLTGKIRDKIISVAKKKERQGLISPSQHSYCVDTATVALRDLAELLRDGYRIREIADYVPTVLATVENGHVVLENKSSDSARHWARRAERSIGQVKNVWRQLGLTD